MKNEYKELYNVALEMREKAYAPYSKFKVGASVLLKDAKIIGGCNIENSSYGLCNCAERNALFRAYMEGYTKDDIEALLVLADTLKAVSPCGACRQVMSELMNGKTKVVLANLKGDFLETSVEQLLPYSFNGDDLDV